MYYDAATDEITTFDGRETAPAAATEDRFTDVEWVDAWQSGLSVGVPGVPRLLEVMHTKYGKSNWSDLFQYAIDLAENGFSFHPSTTMYIPMLYQMMGFNCSGDDLSFFRDPTAKAYFTNADCSPKNQTMYNQDYADTLRSIASGGADDFYTGDIATNIVDAVVNDLNIPGDMSFEDLMNYEVIERPAVCANYSREVRVCGMGPPSSGGLGVGQILGILNQLEMMNADVIDEDEGPFDVENIHYFTQVSIPHISHAGLVQGITLECTTPLFVFLSCRLSDLHSQTGTCM